MKREEGERGEDRGRGKWKREMETKIEEGEEGEGNRYEERGRG